MGFWEFTENRESGASDMLANHRQFSVLLRGLWMAGCLFHPLSLPPRGYFSSSGCSPLLLWNETPFDSRFFTSIKTQSCAATRWKQPWLRASLRPRLNGWLFVPLFRLILKVLSQYRADWKVTTVGLRALALLLRSGA